MSNTSILEIRKNLKDFSEIWDIEVKRNEYFLNYSGTMKNSSLKRPKVKLVLFEGSRTLKVDEQGTDCYLVYSFDGQTEGYEKLADAVNAAYDNMGSVWKPNMLAIRRAGNFCIEVFSSLVVLLK